MDQESLNREIITRGLIQGLIKVPFGKEVTIDDIIIISDSLYDCLVNEGILSVKTVLIKLKVSASAIIRKGIKIGDYCSKTDSYFSMIEANKNKILIAKSFKGDYLIEHEGNRWIIPKEICYEKEKL